MKDKGLNYLSNIYITMRGAHKKSTKLFLSEFYGTGFEMNGLQDLICTLYAASIVQSRRASISHCHPPSPFLSVRLKIVDAFLEFVTQELVHAFP